MLVAGGFDQTGDLVGAELFDPTTETFRPAGSGFRLRGGHGATAWPDGRVLIVGGSDGTRTMDSVQIYDPTADLFGDAPVLPPND